MTSKITSVSTKSPIKRALLVSALAFSVGGAGALTPIFMPANPVLAEAVQVLAPQAPSFADVVEAVSPAVVSVRVESEIQPASNRDGFRFDRRRGGEGERGLEEFFRGLPGFGDRSERRRHRGEREFGQRRGREGRRGQPRKFGSSQGSGFFVSEDGYLVTNHHVIERGSKFTVVMSDGTELEAALIGADPRTDLAVLKVKEERKFTYVQFGEKEPRIGDWVVAVGNPFGLGGTVTAGIVSARGREISSNGYDDFIQIDAAVNKGNSGGPAFDLSGNVIGVNTAIFSPSGGSVGIAFSIPASTAKTIVMDLIDDGQVVRGWLGVQIQPVTEDIAESLGLAIAKGAIVTNPQAESPAEKAGVRVGDVITDVNGKAIKGPRELARTIGSFNPDTEIDVTVWRNGEAKSLKVKLGKLKAVAGKGSSTRSGKPKELAGLGLELEGLPDGGGVVVIGVNPEGPAAKKGLRNGDVISSINGGEVNSPQDVEKAVKDADQKGRKSTLLQTRRGDKSFFVVVPIKKG